MRAAQDIEVVQTQRDIQESSNRVIVILLLVTVGALITGVVLAIVLPRRLVANLDKLVAAARGSDAVTSTRRSGSPRDEVGELAERFGEMQAGLKRLQQLAAPRPGARHRGRHPEEPAATRDPKRGQLRHRPCSAAGEPGRGDWYDIELRGSELTFVIGDASGKGIGAALMSTVALTSLRAERGLGAWAQRLIEQANEVLREATAEDSFTTMIYATLDLEQGGARWLNMGHLAPFLLRSGGSGGFVEGPRNRVLGWFDDPGYWRPRCVSSPGTDWCSSRMGSSRPSRPGATSSVKTGSQRRSCDWLRCHPSRWPTS